MTLVSRAAHIGNDWIRGKGNRLPSVPKALGKMGWELTAILVSGFVFCLFAKNKRSEIFNWGCVDLDCFYE